jgi:4-hydroxybenzoate polyprenyltransferase
MEKFVPAPRRPLARVVREAAFLIKVARPGFWLTSAWFFMLPLGGSNAWRQPEFWLGLFYVSFPLGLLLYGWNDLVDAETDRLNPRKDTFLFGARPDAAQLARLPWQIALVQIPFVAAFTSLLGVKALVWLAALTAACAIYNWPRIGAKARPGFDLLNQCGYLLVFVLSSWLSGRAQAPWFTFAFGALFAMHSHLFGEIMDHEPDHATGRRTTAVAIGVVPSKLLLAALLVAESLLAQFAAGEKFTALALAGGAVWFIADATLLWRARPYATWQMRFAFLGWNAAAALSAPWMWHAARFAAH